MIIPAQQTPADPPTLHPSGAWDRSDYVHQYEKRVKERDNALEIIRRLIHAQHEKDAHGVTARYRQMKEGLWEAARSILPENVNMETNTSLPGMEGVWSSEGAFTIEWQDEDLVKVTKHWSGFDDVAVLSGGDFETILETIFVGAVVTRVHSQATAGVEAPPIQDLNEMTK